MAAGSGTCSIVGSGCNNIASGDFSFVGGGACNTASGTCSFIGGGQCNIAAGNISVLVAGCGNRAISPCSFIGGGCNNRVCNSFFGAGGSAVIVGGVNNYSETSGGVIMGGAGNCMIGNAGTGQVIGGGSSNLICSFNNGGGTENAIFSGLGNTIINCSNVTGPLYYQPNLILGGIGNCVCTLSFIVGGATIIAGAVNTSTNEMSTVINGAFNCAFGPYSIVSGSCNVASGSYSMVLGCCSNSNNLDYAYVFGCQITAGGAACTAYFNNLCVYGTVSKGSGFFKIPHPDPIKAEAGKFLKHSFVESPTAGDNIYRYNVTTLNCSASIELPDYYNLLNGNDQVWVSPICHFGSAYGFINENQTSLSICSNADGDYNVLLIGTRKDKLALDNWNGTEVEANEKNI
jgi:hypothetical protein